MISRALVRQIEEHSGRLTEEALEAIRTDPHTTAYSRLDDVALRGAVDEFLHHLGVWLTARTDHAVESYYRKIGLQRCLQGIPISQLVRALMLVRAEVLRFLTTAAVGDAFELELESQLKLAICEFIDKAIYYASVGYEDACLAALEQAPAERHAPSIAAGRATDVPGAALELGSVVSRAGQVGEVSG
jgi:hypothetical protein